MPSGPTFLLERAFPDGHVCGVDEAGRGPWAGPVSAGAVILDPNMIPKGLDDSKKLTAKAREALEPQIKASALAGKHTSRPMWGAASRRRATSSLP